MSGGAYLLGVAELAVVLAGAAAASTRLRARLLPGWSGPPAWLADLVLALAVVLWIAELLGAVGLFGEIPFVLAVAATGVAIRALIGAGPVSARMARLPAPPAWGPARWAALLAVGLLFAHWSIGVRLTLDSGITNFDSTWYHGPFAAGFAQDHSTFDLHFIAPQFLAWFYPQNSELLHGVGILAFGHDNLSPLVNTGWLAGILLAAWCVGRPFGVGPQSLIGAAIVLDSGALADQAGSMRNDVAAIFFLTAAVAVLVNARAADRGRPLAPGVLVVAGLAAGLAAGVKLNYLLPALALAAGLVLLARPGTRRAAALLAGAPLLAGCGFWYLRNLVHSGSPLPWARSLGPISLPGPDQPLGGRRQESVLGYLLDGSTWTDWFLPGLHHSLGWLWPAVVGAALVALLVCLTPGRDPLLRVLGAVGLITFAVWIGGPASAAGPSGSPLSFESGLRYLAPALILGLTLLPVAAQAGRGPRAAALLAVLLAALLFADASGEAWYSGYVAGAVAVGAVAAAVAWLAGGRRPGEISRPLLAAGLVAVALIVIGAGWVEQRRYLDHRYAEPRFATPGLNAAFAWARDVRDARIATTATRQYPLWGKDLSNRVAYAGVHEPQGGFVKATSCRQWRAVIDAGDYDYVVASLDRPGGRRFPPEAAWTRDPNATVVLRRAPTVVYRIDGPLPVERCSFRDAVVKRDGVGG